MSVLGPGAYGDPEQPWLTRDEFDAQNDETAAGDEAVPAPVVEPDAVVAPAPTQDES